MSAHTPAPTPAPRATGAVRLRLFEPGDAEAFRALNEAWISKYFRLEDEDRKTLGDPIGSIIAPGGRIVMALIGGEPVGCCALIPMGGGRFELGKMAVTEPHRGRGIGRQVLAFAIAQARALGASSLYLGSNSRLKDAIHLYESVGFRHLAPEAAPHSPYARADVHMELTF